MEIESHSVILAKHKIRARSIFTHALTVPAFNASFRDLGDCAARKIPNRLRPAMKAHFFSPERLLRLTYDVN